MPAENRNSRQRLIETIRASIIGDDQAIDGPFGQRRVTYADYTASGRSLSFIEDYIRDEVIPLYANTHTETSGTGLQTTRFREEARQIIHQAVGGSDEDVVIFCGSGATGAICKLIDILNLRIPNDLEARYQLGDNIPPRERPVVFIGPYEHHSNELPWRESIAEVVEIEEDSDGLIDQAALERELRAFADRPLKIGSFSAASNVTGICSDTHNISVLLHRYGALALWDFAAAGPYVGIEMNPLPDEIHEDAHLAYKDAVFLSPHKFIGGPQTPGVLVVKRRLVRNRVPTTPGGGTVAYVNAVEHRYLADPVHREEGGTPAIIESIRAGLVFQLKQAVGVPVIERLEREFVQTAVERWSENPNIRILGKYCAHRLSIVSFMVRYGGGGDGETERFLHHNFVVALLNDLFGVQARGGCSCAGPYGHRLLGIGLVKSREYEREIMRGCEGVKPGWVRINFNYFISQTVFDYLITAVDLVAREGWKLLPCYRFCPESGEWRHFQGRPTPPHSLFDNNYRSGRLSYRSRRVTEPEEVLADYIDEARRIIDEAPRAYVASAIETPKLSGDFETLRWFPLPSEVAADLERETGSDRGTAASSSSGATSAAEPGASHIKVI